MHLAVDRLFGLLQKFINNDFFWSSEAGHSIQLPLLMATINRSGHFLLTEAVTKTASKNELTGTVNLKTTASINILVFTGGML